jgi:hypothetical protein
MPEITKENQQIKMDVVIKDRTLDTVAIAHLIWILETN